MKRRTKQNAEQARHSKIAGCYATACRMAYANGEPKPDWETFKQQYNYYGSTTIINNSKSEHTRNSTTQAIKNNARRQEKTLKEIKIIIKNVTTQADILDDFFQELAEKHPEYKTFHKLSDYIFGSILDIQEKIQIL